MSPHTHGVRSGKAEGLLLTLEAVLDKFIKELDKDLVANSLVWAIKRVKLTEEVLGELDSHHFFHNIWLEEPVKVLDYFPYEKKYIRGSSNKILSFGHEHAEIFHPLRQALETLYKKDVPNHFRDNKVVYVYELKDGRKIAVMFKDGRTVFGNTWDVQEYY